jgi:hypothetical protein
MKPLTSVLAIASIFVMLFTGFAGCVALPDPKNGVPFNRTSQQCVPFNESPLSLKDIHGITDTPTPDQRKIKPDDLDNDGFSNTVELLARSDPTNAKSTPNDRDGDGYPSWQEEAGGDCDFDASRPRPLDVTFKSITESDGVNDGKLHRLQSFTAVVNVTRPNPNPAGGKPIPESGAAVHLIVNQSGVRTVIRDMTPTGTAGDYQVTVPILINDPSNGTNGTPWLLDVNATAVDGKHASVEKGSYPLVPDGRKTLVVLPNEFSVAIKTFGCKGVGAAKKCEERHDFYNDQDITVRAFPSGPNFFFEPGGMIGTTPLNPYAEIAYSGEIDLGNGFVYSVNAKSKVNMTWHEGGPGAPYWEYIIHPNSEFSVQGNSLSSGLPLSVINVVDKNGIRWPIQVNATDEAGLKQGGTTPNFGSDLKDALVKFVPQTTITLTTPKGATANLDTYTRTQTIQFRAVWNDSTNRTAAGPVATGFVRLTDDDDGNGGVAFVDVPITRESPTSNVYTGSYRIDAADPIGSSGGPIRWEARANIDGVRSGDDANYLTVNPKDIPGNITAPAKNSFKLITFTLDTTFKDQFIEVPVSYKLDNLAFAPGTDYCDKNPVPRPPAVTLNGKICPADFSAPGTVTFDVYNPTGPTGEEIVTLGDPLGDTLVLGESNYDFATRTFHGVMRIPTYQALLSTGTWKIYATHRDQAQSISNGHTDVITITAARSAIASFGYHPEFTFTPALVPNRGTEQFAFDGSGNVRIKVALYDENGKPKAFASGPEVRAQLVLNSLDFTGLRDTPPSPPTQIKLFFNALSIDGADQNQATFDVPRKLLTKDGQQPFAGWTLHVQSPNEPFQGDSDTDPSHQFPYAFGFYNSAAKAAFATSKTLADALDGAPTPVFTDGALGPSGYHVEFAFNPPLGKVGGFEAFQFDLTGHVKVTATLYDATGRAKNYVHGSELNKPDAQMILNSVNTPKIFKDPDTVSGNVATFTLSESELKVGSVGNADLRGWEMHVESPYEPFQGDLNPPETHPFPYAFSFYNTIAQTQFGSNPALADALDAAFTPVFVGSAPAPVDVRQTPATVTMTDVYGFNDPTPADGGLYSNPAVDRDNIKTVGTGRGLADGKTSSRFIVVEGTVTPQRVAVWAGAPGAPLAEVTGFDRRVNAVGVQFNSVKASGQDYYRLVPVDHVAQYPREIVVSAPPGPNDLHLNPQDPNAGTWRTVFDGQGYCEQYQVDEAGFYVNGNMNQSAAKPITGANDACTSVATNMTVPIQAFAYSGPLADPLVLINPVGVGGNAETGLSRVKYGGPNFYVAGDPTGTFSGLSKYTFDEVYKGPSYAKEVGIARPDGTVWGGGVTMHTADGPLDVRVHTWHWDSVPVARTGLFFGSAQFKDCDGSSSNGNEWCLNARYQVGKAPLTSGLNNNFEPMKKIPDSPGADPHTELFSAVLQGPLDQWGNFPSERFWSRVQVHNEWGYTTRTTTPPFANTVVAEGLNKVSDFSKSTDGQMGTCARLGPAQPGCGYTGTQFTYLKTKAYFTALKGLADYRVNEKIAPPTFNYVYSGDGDFNGTRGESEGNLGRNLYQFVSGSQKSWIAGHVIGDSLTLNFTGRFDADGTGLLVAQQLYSSDPGVAGRVNRTVERIVGSSERDVLTDVSSLNPILSSRTKVVQDAEPSYIRADTSGSNDRNWTTTLDTRFWEEQINWDRNNTVRGGHNEGGLTDGAMRIGFTFKTETGIEETGYVFVRVDRSAYPVADTLSSINRDNREPGAEHNVSNKPTECAGLCTIVFRNTDLNGHGSTPFLTPAFNVTTSTADPTGSGNFSAPRTILAPAVAARAQAVLLNYYGYGAGASFFTPDGTVKRYDVASKLPSERASESQDPITTSMVSDRWIGGPGMTTPTPGAMVGGSPPTPALARAIGVQVAVSPAPYGFRQAAGTGDSGQPPATTFILPKPKMTVEHDLMMAQITTLPPVTVAAPTGWTPLPLTPVTSGGPNAIGMSIFWKMATWTEDASYTFTFDAKAVASGGISSYIGTDSRTDMIQRADGTTSTSGPTDLQRGVARTWTNISLARLLPGASPAGSVGEFNWTLESLAPYAQLALPSTAHPTGVDMLLPDGTYSVLTRGIDGIDTRQSDEVRVGQASGEQFTPVTDTELSRKATNYAPLHSFTYTVENNIDDKLVSVRIGGVDVPGHTMVVDTYSNALEHKIRNSIRDGTEPTFPRGGTPSLPINDLPLADGVDMLVKVGPVANHKAVNATIQSARSTPCDWDGDGIPNDVGCLGILDLEAVFHTHPFLPDSPMDDWDQNGIPNFLDPTVNHRINCGALSGRSGQNGDSDFDGFCDADEIRAGSDPMDPKSTPSGSVSQDVEKFLKTTIQTVTGCDFKSSDPSPTALCVAGFARATAEGLVRQVLNCPKENTTTQCVQDKAGGTAGGAIATIQGAAAQAQKIARDQICGVKDTAASKVPGVKPSAAADDAATCATALATEIGLQAGTLARDTACSATSSTKPSIAECASDFATRQTAQGIATVVTTACGAVHETGNPAALPSVVDCVQRFAQKNLGDAIATAVGTICSTIMQPAPANPSDPAAVAACASGFASKLGGDITGTIVSTVCSAASQTPANPKDAMSAVTCAQNAANGIQPIILGAAKGVVCVKGQFGPAADPTCGGHTVRITIGAGPIVYVFADQTPPRVGYFDGTKENTIFGQATIDQVVGLAMSVVGIVGGAAGKATDADGDGYPTDMEVTALSNPFHKNSRPGHRGAGFPMDWDADGYPNDQEILAGSDPFRECSTPGNKNGGLNPAKWPDMGKTC